MKIKYYFFILLLLLPLRIFSQISRQEAEELYKSLSVSDKIIEEKYCSEDMLRIKIQLTLTNTGKLPIIIFRDGFATLYSVVDSSLADSEKNDFKGGAENLSSMRRISFDIKPDDKELIILKPGDSFSPEVDDYISHKNLPEGTYWVKQIIDVWRGNLLFGKKLQKEWLKDNLFLWLFIVETKPIEFQVKKKTIEPCN